MRKALAFIALWLGFVASLQLIVHPAWGTPANTETQPIPAGSPVYTGVGAPRAYIVSVTNAGTVDLSDGTNPILVPWGGVVHIKCTGLTGTDLVLACFSMHLDATADISDGQISDGVLDDQCHGTFLMAEAPTADMRLEKTRFLQNGEQYAGAQFVGACDRPATAFHLAPCSVAGEGTDCGAASTCDTGTWRGLSDQRAIDKIAGAWVTFDGSGNETCYVTVDI